MNDDKIKKDLEEIEIINIVLDHRVSKLIAENKHFRQTYKQLYDSIKPAHASLQEKVLEITALKYDLRKLKEKALVDNAVTKHTIDLEMLKIDVEPITSKLLNKKTAHSAYIKHTQEEATVLRDLVEHVKLKYLLDHSLESAWSNIGYLVQADHSLKAIHKKDKIQNKQVIQIVHWYLDSNFSKHMTGDRSQLTNFVNNAFLVQSIPRKTITWQTILGYSLIIRLGMFRYLEFTTWMVLDITYLRWAIC
ncbi:hypothetical protein Tco_1127986 [Tanacetum coccineum]